MCVCLLILSLAASIAVAAGLEDVYNDAQRYFRRGDYGAAIELWTNIIEAESSGTSLEGIDLSTVYFNRGLSYKRLFKWKEASDDFSMVLGFYPNDAEALYQRGGCYKMMGLVDKADADIARACDLADSYCTAKMLEDKQKKTEKENKYR
jgi:tetratricopeptide (TPR) repeat protein